MSSSRRSGRQRKPNVRYAQDPLEGLDLGDDDDVQAGPLPDDDDSADDFDVSREVEEEAQEEFDDDEVLIDDDSDESDSRNGVGPQGWDETGTDLGNDSGDDNVRRPKEINLEDGRRKPPKLVDIRSRLLLEFHKGGYERRMDSFFGRDNADWKPAIRMRNRWFQFPTLPPRKPLTAELGGMHYSYFQNDRARRLESTQSWHWYYEKGGRQALQKRQISKLLTRPEVADFIPKAAQVSQNVLLGPFKDQKLASLSVGETISFENYWPDPSKSSKNEGQKRNGWLVNIGSRIQCIDWAPNQDQDTHYLCVSTIREMTASAPKGTNRNSAFRPTDSFKDSFQIWAFDLEPTAGGSSQDTNEPKPSRRQPWLSMVLCSEWGYLKEFRWCPVLKDTSKKALDDEDTVYLGLLAGVWSDGKLRVLDISFPRSRTWETQYLHISKAEFEAEPPGTVCTSITWMSSSVIATACANGVVALWSIEETLKREPDSPPKPTFFQLIHESYITSIASGYPSHPYLLATTSMDGYFILTDIRSPFMDRLGPPRARVGSSVVVWMEHAQGWLSPDDRCLVKLFSIRRFFSHSSIARADGNVGAIATSPVHCSVLYGSQDGSVGATTPVRKIFDSRSLVWMQPWFLHEWRRGQSSAQQNGEDHEQTADHKLADGGRSGQSKELLDVARHSLVRITEGYLPREATMNQGDMDVSGEVEISNTVHEEPSSVTALAWNPNIEYGGWAAAGMGSGLLRVEDIAV